MLPTKYQPNRPGCSGEEALLIFLPHLWHDSHLEVPIKTVLAIFHSPNPWKLHMKFGYIWPISFRGEVVWKCGRKTDERRRLPF